MTFEKDSFSTSMGELTITFLGHGTLMLDLDGKIIHVDPFSHVADYSALPKADIILITHEHMDHLDPDALAHIRTPKSKVVLTEICASKVDGGTVLTHGDDTTIDGIKIEAVHAYNIQHKRPDGNPFHPKGNGNGYILTFGNFRLYIAGDTENTPEMKRLKRIDCAFLPMNLPYTMTPAMVADAAKAFKPKVLYPYHFGNTDTSQLVDLLKDTDIDVRIRNLA